MAHRIAQSPSGARGFDCNTVLTAGTAGAFAAAGFAFAVRYLSRTTSAPSPGDLSAGEAQTILASGLALMAVQHVPPVGWAPTAALGQTYGAHAVSNAQAIGLPAGMTIWLDLEGTAAGTQAADVIAYCNTWFGLAKAAGYVPGLYVGTEAVLTSDQLYHALACGLYWKSGSHVPDIATRGYCMVQTIDDALVLDGVAYDSDVIQADRLGSTPVWCVA